MGFTKPRLLGLFTYKMLALFMHGIIVPKGDSRSYEQEQYFKNVLVTGYEESKRTLPYILVLVTQRKSQVAIPFN